MGWIAPSLRLEDAAAFEEMVEDGYLATQLLERRKTVPPMPLTDAQWAQYKSRTLFLAGTNEADMQLALKTIKAMRGGVCVIRGGKVVAKVALPVAGLLSDKRATVVAAESTALKAAWSAAGCTLPYMGFNLIPLSVIPEIRITDRGLVTVPGMQILPLFEPAK